MKSGTPVDSDYVSDVKSVFPLSIQTLLSTHKLILPDIRTILVIYYITAILTIKYTSLSVLNIGEKAHICIAMIQYGTLSSVWHHVLVLKIDYSRNWIEYDRIII